MSAKNQASSGLFTDVLGLRGAVETEECEWCARNVAFIDLFHYSVSDESCPEDLLVMCRDCHPDKQITPGGGSIDAG